MVLASLTGGFAAEVAWHESFQQALAAAQASGKPILVFVHMGEMDRGGTDEQALDAYAQMARVTLTDANVVEATRDFECFELDLRNRANDALRDQLRVGPVVDTAGHEVAVTGIYPVSLFLDSTGTEQFRMHGYFPPVAYVVQLRRARELISCLGVVKEKPDDPVAHRNLGRIYMEMFTEADDKFYRAAVEHLERAIALDPNNTTGANYNARVDLAILRLPDDPEKAFVELFQLQTEDPERTRRFEIQYYMGVAQYAAGNAAAAVQLLESFETADRNSPYFDNEYTPLALALLKVARQELRGR